MKNLLPYLVVLTLSLTVVNSNGRRTKLRGRFNGARQRVTGRLTFLSPQKDHSLVHLIDSEKDLKWSTK